MMPFFERKIVCITGGSGFRYVAKALAKKYPDPTTIHVIGTADSGRSTRQLRIFFDMPAIGDLRSRCIDLADRTAHGFREITELLAYRMPNIGERDKLEVELFSIIDGSHPLTVAALNSNEDFTCIILANLKRFNEARKEAEKTKGPFDLKEGSIGNFFLTGAYLDYGNISSAIFLYEQLAGVRGKVIPASKDKMHLAAEMEDGEVVIGQHNITKGMNPSPIHKLFFLDCEDTRARIIHPSISSDVAMVIEGSNMIVFSMGSFYTSILSPLHLMGMAEAIRKSGAIKVFIPNTVEDPEIRGMTTADMVKKLVSTLKEQDPRVYGANDIDYLQIVIAGNHNEAKYLKDGRRLIRNDFDRLKGFRIERSSLITDSVQEGYYEPEFLANLLTWLK